MICIRLYHAGLELTTCYVTSYDFSESQWRLFKTDNWNSKFVQLSSNKIRRQQQCQAKTSLLLQILFNVESEVFTELTDANVSIQLQACCIHILTFQFKGCTKGVPRDYSLNFSFQTKITNASIYMTVYYDKASRPSRLSFARLNWVFDITFWQIYMTIWPVWPV